ncbi:MAG: solute carrier family 26 protein [Cyclobacteriaceae bacterium]|nr:solute carrier family 26 protein [Cyclobacteriaceae bacterium]
MKTIKKGYLNRFFPVFTWATEYKQEFLKGDISAGLTVGIMLIPQGMAYALLAGLEPIHGLYAVTVPLILYALFGTSRQLAVGPVAMVSLLTAAGIGALSPETPQLYLLYALTIAFLVGIIQAGMGLLRLGFLVNFISHPVISGFTSAAAIIIGLSQIKHLFRINLPRSEHVQDMLIAIYYNIADIHWITFIIGIAGIIIIKYGKKIHNAIPTPLVAVVLGILAVHFFNLSELGVSIVGVVPEGLPTFSSPSFNMDTWKTLMPIAATIAFVGFAESYAIAKTIQSKHKSYKLDPNQELIGLGMANFGAAFFQGYPVTGGFSRTAVNDQAGAKTALASIISALLIIFTLLFLTELFYNLPNAILAAVVLVAVSGLVNVKEPFELWKKDKSDFAMLISTFLITLTLGIETGIIAGMVLSLVMVIYRASRPHMARLGRVPGTNVYRNIKRFKNLEMRKEVIMVRIDGPIYFANIDFIIEKLNRWIAEDMDELKMVILNMESIISIDSTGAHVLNEWIIDRRKEGLDVCMSGAKGPVRDALNRWGIIECLGTDHVFIDSDQAMSFLDKAGNLNEVEKMRIYAIQTDKN